MYTQVLDWPRATKRAVVILLDVVLCLVSMWLAFSLRLNTFHLPQGTQWWAYLMAPLIAILIFNSQPAAVTGAHAHVAEFA